MIIDLELFPRLRARPVNSGRLSRLVRSSPQNAAAWPTSRWIVSSELMFRTMELTAGPPTHWIVTLADGGEVHVWADGVTGISDKASYEHY